MIFRAAVTCSDLKKFVQTLLKNHLQFLAMPTSATTDAMALNFFPDTIQLFSHTYWIKYWCYGYEIFSRHYPFKHIYGFEGYSSQYKIDEMMNKHSNSCK